MAVCAAVLTATYIQVMHLACMLERRVEASSTCDALSSALASVAALMSLASPQSALEIAAESPEKSSVKGTKGSKKGASAAAWQLPAQAVMLRTLARLLRQCLVCMRLNSSSGSHLLTHYTVLYTTSGSESDISDCIGVASHYSGPATSGDVVATGCD